MPSPRSLQEGVHFRRTDEVVLSQAVHGVGRVDDLTAAITELLIGMVVFPVGNHGDSVHESHELVVVPEGEESSEPVSLVDDLPIGTPPSACLPLPPESSGGRRPRRACTSSCSTRTCSIPFLVQPGCLIRLGIQDEGMLGARRAAWEPGRCVERVARRTGADGSLDMPLGFGCSLRERETASASPRSADPPASRRESRRWWPAPGWGCCGEVG